MSLLLRSEALLKVKGVVIRRRSLEGVVDFLPQGSYAPIHNLIINDDFGSHFLTQ